MIDALILCVGIAALGTLATWWFDDPVRRVDITCRCGRSHARNALIVDAKDEQRIADALTEVCPACALPSSLRRSVPPSLLRESL